MPDSLHIRNVTAIQIELKVWEKFPDAAQVAGSYQTDNRHDVSVPIAPFTSVETPFETLPRDSTQVIRLTFHVDKQTYYLHLPKPANRSTTLQPLAPDPRNEITAVYLPQCSYLALYASSHLDSWMAKLPDTTSLAALSIPGTHNSPTCHRALPSVRCQAVSPRAQLDNGVRFFDVRVQPMQPMQPMQPGDAHSDALALVHSAFPVSLTGTKYFRALIDDVLRFLDEHRSETVLMSVKREGTGSSTDSDLAVALRNHYVNAAPDRWFVTPRVPRLGEARGRIILLRRFGLPGGFPDGFGLDGGAWADNTACATCPSGHLCIQDFYEVGETENLGTKLRYAQEHLARAAEVAPGAENAPIHVNFLSASNFWKRDLWPEKIAAKMNPGIVEYLCRWHAHGEDGCAAPGSGSAGVVVCDWVGNQGDWDLVWCIVGMNSKLIA